LEHVSGEDEISVSFGNGFTAFPATNHPAAHFLPAVRARHGFGAICQPVHNQLLANFAHHMRPPTLVAMIAAESIHPLTAVPILRIDPSRRKTDLRTTTRATCSA
jgi:hypothetical protein